MTLILTLVTHRLTIQVSDRRATYPDGAYEEVMNKAVLLGRTATASYTGLAFLDGRHPTDETVMDSLTQVLKHGSGLDRVANTLTGALRLNQAIPKVTEAPVARTSIVLTGFCETDGDKLLIRDELAEPVRPFLATVSNAHDDLEGPWLPTPLKGFRVHSRLLADNDTLLLHVAGQPLEHSEEVLLKRSLRRALARTAQPESAMRLMARMVQTVADRNAAVGRNVMCVAVRRSNMSLPKPNEQGETYYFPFQAPIREHAWQESNWFRGGSPDEEQPWGVYLPDLRRPGVVYGPSYLDHQVQVHSPIASWSDLFGPANENLERVRAGRRSRHLLP